jgi:ribosome-associated heat shock protein Hsp15
MSAYSALPSEQTETLTDGAAVSSGVPESWPGPPVPVSTGSGRGRTWSPAGGAVSSLWDGTAVWQAPPPRKKIIPYQPRFFIRPPWCLGTKHAGVARPEHARGGHVGAVAPGPFSSREIPLADPSRGPVSEPTDPAPARLDRWLWAARCFKTRALAKDACDAGHVKLNGAAAGADKRLKPGDILEVVTPGGRRTLAVVALAVHRGPPAAAAALFEDRTPVLPPDAPAPEPSRDRGEGRPSKRDGRLLRKMRGW